jgi:hypothetical protein
VDSDALTFAGLVSKFHGLAEGYATDLESSHGSTPSFAEASAFVKTTADKTADRELPNRPLTHCRRWFSRVGLRFLVQEGAGLAPQAQRYMESGA